MIETIVMSLLIFAGIWILLKGADYMVDGSADLARFLKISPIVVGLTVVAFGTSLPEFIISLFSVLTGNANVALGNVIGSNIANIGLIIGVSALIYPLRIKSSTISYEMPFLIISSFLLIILANNNYIFGSNTFGIERFDSLVFILIGIIFILYVKRKSQKRIETQKGVFTKEYENINSLKKNVFLIILGIVFLSVGGKLFIDAATFLANAWGLSDIFIGAAIAAIGTSLPELFTCINAAKKKHSDIIIGNIIGSNIFNILMVLGITGLIKPIMVSSSIIFIDGMVMVFFTMLFLYFSARDKTISKLEGGTLLGFYIIYFIFLIMRMT